MQKILLISFLLFPTIGSSQIEWTEFNIHVLSSNLSNKKFFIDFPGEQTIDLIEFDRLVDGVVIVQLEEFADNDQEIVHHCGLSANVKQQYQVEFTTKRIWIEIATNEDFWIRFQIKTKK